MAKRKDPFEGVCVVEFGPNTSLVFFKDDVRQPVCHLLEHLLQTNMRVASHDFAHYVHHKLVLPTKGCLYSHHHAKGDIVQNITHDPSIFGHFNFPTKKKTLKVTTPLKNVKWDIQLA
jgi:hypothetical protein